MPIRKLPNGALEFDTAAEVLEYERLSSGSATRVSTRMPLSAVNAAQAEWNRFYGVLSAEKYGNQRQLLIALKHAGREGITRGMLLAEFNLDGNALGGRFSGLTKACQRANIAVDLIYRIEGNTYRATDLLLENDVSLAVG